MANEPTPPDDILRALANLRRLQILRALGDGALWVSDLQARLPLSQSALSQHLARLRDAGIVATRRQGQAVAYRIVDAEILTLAEGSYDPSSGGGARAMTSFHDHIGVQTFTTFREILAAFIEKVRGWGSSPENRFRHRFRAA